MRWFLTIFLITLLIPNLDNIPGGSSVKYLLTLGAAAAIPLSSKRILVFPDRGRENLLFGLMILGGVVSILLNPIPGSILYVVVMPISYVIYNYIRRYGLTKQQVLLLAGVIIVLALPPRYFSARGNLMGMYGNPNVMGPIVTFGLYLLLCLKQRLHWAVRLVAFLLVTALVIATKSRAGMVGYAIFIVAYVVQGVVLKTRFRVLTLLTIILGVVVYYFMITTRTLTLIEVANTTLNSDKQVNFSERDKLFDLFIAEIRTNPVGIGFGQSQKFADRYSDASYSPHNTYLKTAVEGGWMFALFAGLLLSYLILTTKSALTLSFILGYLLRGLFESATPFTMGMTSALLFLPFYLNEYSIAPRRRRRGEIPDRDAPAPH